MRTSEHPVGKSEPPVVYGTEDLLVSLCNSVTRVLNVATNSQVQYSSKRDFFMTNILSMCSFL